MYIILSKKINLVGYMKYIMYINIELRILIIYIFKDIYMCIEV